MKLGGRSGTEDFLEKETIVLLRLDFIYIGSSTMDKLKRGLANWLLFLREPFGVKGSPVLGGASEQFLGETY